MVASLKSADLQIVETFKKSIDIYFKYVSIKEDKEKKINLTVNPKQVVRQSRKGLNNMEYTIHKAEEVHTAFKNIDDVQEKIKFINNLNTNNWFTVIRKEKLVKAWTKK